MTTEATRETGATATTVRRTPSRSTRVLLGCGVLAGPLYLVVSYAQALTRDGFDLARHPFSALSLGDLGWIQIANFVVAGLLYVAAAVGFRRALGDARGGTWGPLLIGVLGLGMVGGGVFVADTAFGFPPGSPEGLPESGTWHGTLHGVSFMVSFVAWTAACFVFARRFAAIRQPAWAAYCVVTGILLVVTPVLLGTGAGVVLLYVTASLGWVWISALAVRLLAETRRSGGRPSPTGVRS